MSKTDNNAVTEELQDNQESNPANETATQEQSQSQTEATPADLLVKKESELQEMKDKYLRLAAEFDNYRRRTAQERLEERQTAGRDLMVSLLDVLDDFDRAEKGLDSDQEVQTMKEGVKLVFQKLRSTLENRGLKSMDSRAMDFDADLHEAVAEIPAADASLQGKVIDELQKGYKLNDRIIRFAKVVVGK